MKYVIMEGEHKMNAKQCLSKNQLFITKSGTPLRDEVPNPRYSANPRYAVGVFVILW